MIEMICPHCKLGLKFPEEYAGQKGQCDKCGGVMYVQIPSYLRKQEEGNMAYQFNVSLDEMQSPNLGMDDSGVRNVLDTSDLAIMSATSGMSARSMGATSYSHSYDHLKPAVGAGLGGWFKIAGWLGVPALILSGIPLLGAIFGLYCLVVLVLAVVDVNKHTGDTKSTLLWLLGLLFLFPIMLPVYMFRRGGMAQGKAIGLGVAIGVVSMAAMFTVLVVSRGALDAGAARVENTGAVELNPPVNIQSDAGAGQ